MYIIADSCIQCGFALRQGTTADISPKVVIQCNNLCMVHFGMRVPALPSAAHSCYS